MCVLRMKPKAKTGRGREPAHQSTMDESSHMKGVSPQSTGALSSFYSTGPVCPGLMKTITPVVKGPALPSQFASSTGFPPIHHEL